MSVLAILEQQDGQWHRMSWETLAAAQQFGAALGRAGGSGGRRQRNRRARRRSGHQESSRRSGRWSTICWRPTPPTATPPRSKQLIRKAQPIAGAVPAHLSGARFRAEARHAIFASAGQRRDRGARRRRRAVVLVRQLFQGKLNGDVRVQRARARTSPRCRPARGEPMRSKPAPPPVETFTPAARCRADPPEARSAVPRSGARRGSDRRRDHRLGRPRHQGRIEHRRWSKSLPRRSAPSLRRRGPSATRDGFPWSARWAAPVRRLRRKCISPSASPARFSTWWA